MSTMNCQRARLRRALPTLVAGGMLLALVAAPGRADVKQVSLGVKGAT